MTSSQESSEAERLVADLVRGAWRSLTARAMAELRLADALVQPATADEVAGARGLHGPTLDRLLRTLTALGLLSHEDGRFVVTEAGARLRSDVPGSDWGAMMMMPAPWTLATWHHLPEAVRTGEPVFEDVHGSSFWEHLRAHEEVGRTFDAAMARGAKDEEPAALVAGELQRCGASILVDVGGGTGRLLAQVVARVPHLEGVLADRAEPVEGSASVFAEHGVERRCRAQVADFFVGVPPGDVFLLSNILHDWDDRACAAILDRVHRACAPGGRVIVLESVLPDEGAGIGPESAQLRLLDLMMLLNFGARERTLDQYSELLHDAGFVDIRLLRRPQREASGVSALVAAGAGPDVEQVVLVGRPAGDVRVDLTACREHLQGAHGQ